MNENNNNKNNPLSNINDRLFITNEMDKQKPFYRWTPPENIETRFGIELETCIKINKNCIDFDLSQLHMLEPVLFRQKFNYYYKNIITKSKYFPKLAEHYKYLVVDDTEIYYYDMMHPEELGKTENELEEYLLSSRPANKNYEKEVKEKIKELNRKYKDYELPIFIDDVSIRCGDTRNKIEREKAFIDNNESFRFECITPILSIKGSPTKDKIAKVLEPFLLLFGLGKLDCFILNYSMGFHVNVSLYNTKRREYIPIAEPPFLNQLFKTYIPIERQIYKTVRTRRPKNANESENYITNFARPLYGNLNKYKKNANDRFYNGETRLQLSENDIINKIMTMKEYAEYKYKAIKKKSPYLLEFRLFEGDSDIRKLITNVFTTLDILHNVASHTNDLNKKPNNKTIKKPNKKTIKKLNTVKYSWNNNNNNNNNNNSNNNNSNNNNTNNNNNNSNKNNYNNNYNSNNSVNPNLLGGKRINKTRKRK
jgi:hypothetical protein